MHKHPAISVQTIPDELIAGRKMLQEVLIIDIVDFHDLVIEALKKCRVQWKSQDREHMGNATSLQRFSAA